MARAIATLNEAMKSIFNDPKSSDFKLVCADETFHVHSLILSTRSGYFRGLMNGPFKESKDRFANLDDVDAEALRDLLLGIYTDDYDTLSEEEAIPYFERELAVMILAKRFLIHGLDHVCASHLERIDLHNGHSIERDECMTLLVDICKNFQDQEAVQRLARKFASCMAYMVQNAASDEVLKSCPALLLAFIKDMAPHCDNFVYFKCSHDCGAEFRFTVKEMDGKSVAWRWNDSNAKVRCPGCGSNLDLKQKLRNAV